MSPRPDLNEWDDLALAERACLRGALDDRPFTILFERHQHTIWAVCFRFTGDAADAEDLLQEVFIKAYRNLNTFQGHSTFRTWLYQIALNTCRNELRRRKRRPSLIDDNVHDLDLIDTTASSPEDGLEESENIAEALMKLRSEEREILILRDIEEMSYASIAETLGIQLSAAKMRVQRARISLASALHSHALLEDRL